MLPANETTTGTYFFQSDRLSDDRTKAPQRQGLTVTVPVSLRWVSSNSIRYRC
jgi:hypothetical protein